MSSFVLDLPGFLSAEFDLTVDTDLQVDASWIPLSPRDVELPTSPRLVAAPTVASTPTSMPTFSLEVSTSPTALTTPIRRRKRKAMVLDFTESIATSGFRPGARHQKQRRRKIVQQPLTWAC